MAELDTWLADPTSPRALLVAEAGRGKSALLAHWIADLVRSEAIAVAFVPVSIRYETASQRTAISLLGARLRHLHDVVDEPPRDLYAWKTEIDRYLRADRSDTAPLLVVIDGIDEAVDWQISQSLPIPDGLGRNIKLLLSARRLANRDAAGWLEHLGWPPTAPTLALPPLTLAGVREVVLALPLSLGGAADVMAETLFRLSAGDPLLVKLYTDLLHDTGVLPSVTPGAMPAPPSGLTAFFDQWWVDQRRQWGDAAPLTEPAVRALLEVLACALGPLHLTDLVALLAPEGFDAATLQDALRPLARLVVGDGERQGYVFSHPRLSDYIAAQLAPEARAGWEQRLCDYGCQTLHALRDGQYAPKAVSAYAMRHYGAHLERAGATSAALDELVCSAWQHAWEALDGTPDGFLYDIARAWRRAERDGAQAETTETRGQAIALQCRYALITTTITSGLQSIPAALIVALVERGAWSSAWGLAYAQRLTDSSQVAALLAGLAPHLEETQLAAALDIAQRFAHEVWDPEGLIGLAPMLAEPLLRVAIATAHELPDDDEMLGDLRSRTLATLLPNLATQGARDEALAAIHVLGDAAERVRGLVAIAQHLSHAERVEALASALAVARTIDYPGARVEALVMVLPHLSNAMHTTVLHIVRTAALERLVWDAGDLLTSLLPTVLAAVRALEPAGIRALSLARLAKHAPAADRSALVDEALAAARTAHDDSGRQVQTLVELAGQLSATTLTPALEIARAIADPGGRSAALARLARHLDGDAQAIVLAEAFDAVRDVAGQGHDMTLMACLEAAPPVSETLLRDAVRAVQAISFDGWRERALAALAPALARLPVADLYPIWCELFRALSSRSRRDLLVDLSVLAPILTALGGDWLVDAVAQAIVEVQHWGSEAIW